MLTDSLALNGDAAVRSTGLGQEIDAVLPMLVPPVLPCLRDPDSLVRCVRVRVINLLNLPV